MNEFLTDDATRDPARDSLNFSQYRPALKKLLTTAQTPLTVGVFGAWGSGKTSLMRMLQTEIEAEMPQLRTVWFTAWKYDRHDVLWRALILRVLDALYPRAPGPGMREDRPVLDAAPGSAEAKLIALLRQLEDSVYQAVSWQEVGPRSPKWGELLANTGQAGTEIALNLLTAGYYGKLKEQMGGEFSPGANINEAAAAISREMKDQQRRQLFHMEQFEASFQAALSLLPQGSRLVVFVDDLDRCLPEKAIEVLEAIKLFLEVPGTVFVLAMDRTVIQRGIEARYSSFFGHRSGSEPAPGAERAELPIHGDSYLQKIIQIPFHLPPLAVADLDSFIKEQAADLPPMTRAVFARGLYPNPRQLKRALNVFYLLQQIATARAVEIAGPLLAKTVVIQSQYPALYEQWRQRPMLIQTLEREYERRPVTEEETFLGRPVRLDMPADGTVRSASTAEARRGGLLDDYLDGRGTQFALLVQMLTYPPLADAGAGVMRARFDGLSLAQMAAYVRLAGAVETETPGPPAVLAADDEALLRELLSGDIGRIEQALGELDHKEPDPSGPRHDTLRRRLLLALQANNQPAVARAGAGSALALLGDPRFRADAWFLPAEPLLGFVEIPAGPFLMGTDPALDPAGGSDEQPQHTVELPTYYLARMAVTVAQFRAFVDDSGFTPINDDGQRGLANHPVVWVGWDDANAYAAWLTGKLRDWEGTPEPLKTLLRQGEADSGPWRLQLPSEAEWEKGARGDDGRLYPWGNVFDPARANVAATGIATTTAAGTFPGGTSPFGLLDMVGNCEEWTRTAWGFGYPYAAGDGREAIEKGRENGWGVRGGYFGVSQPEAYRCAFRGWNSPAARGRGGGFRLLLGPPV